jgi:septum formation protein
LASASPRRRKLLTEAGYNFKIIVSDVDESSFSSADISPAEFATSLAFAKAMDVAKKNHEELVLGADTVVDFQGEIIGKADNAEQAEQITRKLFSKPHKVITAVALVRLCDGVKIIDYDTTVVYPKQMTAEHIAEHIAGNSWQGKAGAYAIQETGDKFIEKIRGSMTNVVGLPMELVNKLLSDLLYRQDVKKDQPL